ncbi:hypothetical protein [Oceanobacillus alkalisoli]|uniref:hypothetical protein n=1 Tax=Oceanobacillus alkalisoli TaxID=2925113 RepID=UPI001EE4766B|nr:hypothetical protein [Oceanobacillus alkalisoli]MCG5104468.1 hypothetical protein [Oceanobacillus alkalisoli]
MKGLFIKSMQHKEKIVIFYMDSNNEVTERYVRVLKMNDSHILVYCYYRKKVRTLKFDNILSCGSVRGVAI